MKNNQKKPLSAAMTVQSGEEYLSNISQNPFQVPDEVHFRRERLQQRNLEKQFMEQVPLFKRSVNSARSKMLSLKEEQLFKKPAQRPVTGKLNYSQLRNELYMPTKMGRFSGIPDEDKRFLETLPRGSGQKEPQHVMLQKQKDIFLLQLNLEDKNREAERLNEALRMKTNQILNQEKVLEIKLQKFEKEVKDSDRETIENVMLQELAVKNRISTKQKVEQMTDEQLKLNSVIEKTRLRIQQLNSYKKFLYSLNNQIQQFEDQKIEYQTTIQQMTDFYKQFCTLNNYCFECSQKDFQQYFNNILAVQSRKSPQYCCNHLQKISYQDNSVDNYFLEFIKEFEDSGIEKSMEEVHMFADICYMLFYEVQEKLPFESTDDVMKSFTYKDKQRDKIQEDVQEAEIMLERGVQRQRDICKKYQQLVINEELKLQQNQLIFKMISGKDVKDYTENHNDLSELFKKRLEIATAKIQRMYQKIFKVNIKKGELSEMKMLSEIEVKLEQRGLDCQFYEVQKAQQQSTSGIIQVSKINFQLRKENEYELERKKRKGEKQQKAKYEKIQERVERSMEKAKEPTKSTAVRQVKKKMPFNTRQVGNKNILEKEKHIQYTFFGDSLDPAYDPVTGVFKNIDELEEEQTKMQQLMLQKMDEIDE